jgi:hypothetical protein
MNICGFFLQSLIIENYFPNYPKTKTKTKQEKKRFPLNSPKILELPLTLKKYLPTTNFQLSQNPKVVGKDSGLHQTHSGI